MRDTTVIPNPERHWQHPLHLGLIFVLLGLLVYRILLIFSYQGEIGGIDNNFVYAVIRGMNGLSLYPDPTAAPYAVNPYSPLYYSVCVTLGKLFALDTREPIHIYWLCRSVSLLCDLIMFVLVFRMIRFRKQIVGSIAFPATVILALLFTYLGYTASRVDSLYLLCYVAAFFYLHTDRSTRPVWRLAVVGFLSAAALFSKQSGLILPLLVAVWLWVTGERKRILYYGLFTLGFILLFFFYYTRFSGERFLLDHTVTGIRNHLDLSWFYVHVFKRTLDSLWVLLLYFPLMIAIRQVRKPKNTSLLALSWVLLIQTGFSLAAALKWGSTPGYFHESFILGLWITAEFLSWHDYEWVRKISRWLLPLFLVFALHVFAQGYLFYIQKRGQQKQVYESQKEIRNWLEGRLGDRMVLDLGQQNQHFFKNLFPSQAAVPNFDIVDCCTLPDGNFDYSALKQDLQSGKIGYLLAPAGEHLSSLWGISLEKYKPDTLLQGQQILRFQE